MLWTKKRLKILGMRVMEIKLQLFLGQAVPTNLRRREEKLVQKKLHLASPFRFPDIIEVFVTRRSLVPIAL